MRPRFSGFSSVVELSQGGTGSWNTHSIYKMTFRFCCCRTNQLLRVIVSCIFFLWENLKNHKTRNLTSVAEIVLLKYIKLICWEVLNPSIAFDSGVYRRISRALNPYGSHTVNSAQFWSWRPLALHSLDISLLLFTEPHVLVLKLLLITTKLLVIKVRWIEPFNRILSTLSSTIDFFSLQLHTVIS